jgi:hypothetical protein
MMPGIYAANGLCAVCNKRDYLTPLHGDNGGPMCCLLCKGSWHAEHGRRRRTGRIVIRALKAYEEAGGKWNDFDKLKLSAATGLFRGLDPLGYLADTADTIDETVDLTSELLNDTLSLVHPDKHPPERRELAQRVTQRLLALKPFVFPAPPKPKPVEPVTAKPSKISKDETDAVPIKNVTYPCKECADTTPYFYCKPCRTEYERRQQEETERRRAKHRRWYAQRKARREAFGLKAARKANTEPRQRNSRQSKIVVNQSTRGSLVNRGLSGLQAAILTTALTKRVRGARGCDVSQAELLATIWGWEPQCKLRHTKPNGSHRRAGDTMASADTHGAFNHIPFAERRAARASLSRALTRLHKRELVSFVDGTIGTYSGGLVLTPHGESIARLLVK